MQASAAVAAVAESAVALPVLLSTQSHRSSIGPVIRTTPTQPFRFAPPSNCLENNLSRCSIIDCQNLSTDTNYRHSLQSCFMASSFHSIICPGCLPRSDHAALPTRTRRIRQASTGQSGAAGAWVYGVVRRVRARAKIRRRRVQTRFHHQQRPSKCCVKNLQEVRGLSGNGIEGENPPLSLESIYLLCMCMSAWPKVPTCFTIKPQQSMAGNDHS